MTCNFCLQTYTAFSPYKIKFYVCSILNCEKRFEGVIRYVRLTFLTDDLTDWGFINGQNRMQNDGNSVTSSRKMWLQG